MHTCIHNSYIYSIYKYIHIYIFIHIYTFVDAFTRAT